MARLLLFARAVQRLGAAWAGVTALSVRALVPNVRRGPFESRELADAPVPNIAPCPYVR
jgi:hypothetical protein